MPITQRAIPRSCDGSTAARFATRTIGLALAGASAQPDHRGSRDEVHLRHVRRIISGDLIMSMQRLLSALLVSLPLAVPLPAMAQGNPATTGQARPPAARAAWSEGVVKAIHKQDGQITIAHVPLANLGMGKMTMTFRLKTPALIEGVKEGSNIRFVAENVNGELTVVALQTVK
jgi:Cu(I)/Ag(I) efflux system protein CusF